MVTLLLAELVDTSQQLRATRSRKAKVAALDELLSRVQPDEAEVAVAYLSGAPRQERLGVGYATVGTIAQEPATPPPSLSLREVDDALANLASQSGKGSEAARMAILTDLFARATTAEQQFLRGLLLREVRQGAQQGIMIEALASVANAPPDEVRRAVMVSGDLTDVGRQLLTAGPGALDSFHLQIFHPLLPMLAQTSEDIGTALGKVSPASIEYKVDGARLQLHKRNGEVRAYTRNLREVTDRIPEIVALVKALPLSSAILDGEAIALRPDGRPYPFQVTMGRFGTEKETPREGRLTLTILFFDILHANGADLLDVSLGERWTRLEELLPPSLRVPRIVTEAEAQAEEFLQQALDGGHEGVMVKALNAPYEAGRRGAGWLKVKRAHTLDLVVLAAEWGSGRRKGWLSNLHLGARDPETAGFVMLGKTFKGLTDEMLSHRSRPPGRRGRGRLRRCPGEQPLSGRYGPPLRQGQGLSTRQGSRGRRHDRHGALNS